MNKFLILAGVFMLVSLFNLLNVFLTGSGISLMLGVFWLAGSAYVFIQYRKMKAKNEEKPQENTQEAIEG
jgi:uncharacterized membrane protein HdeD (DUF308 family)